MAGTAYTTPGLSATTTYTLTARKGAVTVQQSVTVQVAGLVWVKDIVYLGAKEVGEVDVTGLHVTLTDHLGSPRYELSVDGTHAVAEQKYMPFGESLTDPATMKQFAKGFTNHEQTDLDGLIYMQARFYAPIYGRFLSPDPARDQHFEQTQSWNIYSYVQNNPVMMVDPTGLSPDLPMENPDGSEYTSSPIRNFSDWHRTISPEGREWLIREESVSIKNGLHVLYNDNNDPAKANATIGYGYKVHDGKVNGSEDQKWKNGLTQPEADTLLTSTLEYFEKNVDSISYSYIPDEHFDALVLFAYNVGSVTKDVRGAYKSGNMAKTAAAIKTHNKAHGVSPALVARTGPKFLA